MEKSKQIVSIGCFFASVVIAMVALICPPLGIIDTSVLWYTAQLLCLCAAIIGVNFNIKDVFKSNKNKS